MEFKQLAEQAAQLEKGGCMNDAASAWAAAGDYSQREDNRDWCDSRAKFCQSRFVRGGQKCQ